jgi:large subunit ribosomal protein L22
MVKGKGVVEALTMLKFDPKRAANPIAKLIASAAANAEKQGEKVAELYVKNITVDKGLVGKRFMPRAFGRASTINKRKSHVTVVLAKRESRVPKRRAGIKKK